LQDSQQNSDVDVEEDEVSTMEREKEKIEGVEAGDVSQQAIVDK
jgi:hypothetical protein